MLIAILSRSMCLLSAVLALTAGVLCSASAAPWISDQGDGTYKNPVLFADYSDPDVIRVGSDFYMTASSFNCVPALPILHSRDLVNWKLIAYAVDRLPARFDTVQHGNGIWAPALRFHAGYYWIVVGDPDCGILMTRAKNPAGPWEPLHVVQEGMGLIDPCPLWDGDKAYLVYAFANSRAGKNSVLVCREMSTDGRQLLGDERIVVDGRNGVHPTIEGPKFYKRGDWYYILAPAGGVKPGWQLAARAKSPLGPYETRRVMEQGTTRINGPHQGGLVELENGDNWFVHFQDHGVYGRVTHLNPVRWIDDWPQMGRDFDGNGIGEPVTVHEKPAVGRGESAQPIESTDSFDGHLGLQWQWQANPRPEWMSLSARPGWLRLHAVPAAAGDLTMVPNQLLQKFAAPEFTATTLLQFEPDGKDAKAGLVVMGQTYAGLFVRRKDDALQLEQVSNTVLGPGGEDQVHASIAGVDGPLWLRVTVADGARCRFSYSRDGEIFESLGETFRATPGKWIGTKVGILCVGADAHADFDSFVVD